ncbi:TetR/AcrR family transcriptional regulator [Chondromyces crocatus]|uniref:TetR family transcriptional regulator n=1 Tax=Chondromyces crocatus TaxID=52 RepID=A0A0K1ET52_CHOCO|nr:TetR/AcrR family transcriptional regulator [Chondromyces crocatus]AKT43827.1 TetR family transcriptional regulator [Chondromyces crocatus]
MCAVRRSGSSEGKLTSTRGPRLRLDLDERRAQLVELGLAAFYERSYDEVSIDDVARSAGVSKGLLYHYFPTKRDFYIACLSEAARQLLATTVLEGAEAPPLERVRHGVEAYLDYVVRHARAYTTLFRGGIGSDPGVVAIIEQTRATYLERLLEGVDGVPFVQGNPPALRLALRGWIGLVEVTSLDWVERRELPLAAICDFLLEMLLSALRASGALAVAQEDVTPRNERA